jgi:hypothetical protein
VEALLELVTSYNIMLLNNLKNSRKLIKIDFNDSFAKVT